MGAESEKAAAVTPPVESNNVVVLAGNTTAQRFKIPSAWRKAWLTIQADGVNLGFVFGGSAVAADLAGTTTLASEAISAYDGGECVYVADGNERHVDMSQIEHYGQDLYLSIDCDATAGFIRLIRSSGIIARG